MDKDMAPIVFHHIIVVLPLKRCVYPILQYACLKRVFWLGK
jgi:hypothetical protein